MAQLISAFLAAVFLLGSVTAGQDHNSTVDPLSKIVDLKLDGQTVFDGLAKLNESTNLGYSVERELTSRKSPRLASEVRLNAQLNRVTVRDALNWLCQHDPRYTWSSDGQMVNFYPRSVENDPNYPLNLKISPFRMLGVNSASAAVLEVSKRAEPPQQLAVLQLGDDSLRLPKPLSFQDMTLRQALNLIAESMGNSHGWQFSGTTEFRYMVFHAKLVITPLTKH